MIDKLSWTRRDFMKAAGVAGAVPIMSGAISIHDGQAAVLPASRHWTLRSVYT
jgi:TAT (twin-arginine translocation) pathway signal sequence